MKTPLFSVGHIVSTPGARAALQAAGVSPINYIGRHITGDWGEVCEADAAENNLSVKKGYRIVSTYTLPDADKTKIWIITEATDDHGHRAATTLLLPSDY